MIYQVTYLRPKKKGYSNQSASFLKIDDAIWWETLMKDEGCKDIKIKVN